MNNRISYWAIAGLCLSASAVWVEPAHAAISILVESNLDGADSPNDPCKLREAIRVAQGASTPAQTLCRTARIKGGVSQIVFDPGMLPATITRNVIQGDLQINIPLSILGPGPDQLTFDTNSNSTWPDRAFTLNTGAKLAISGMRIINGYTGGGGGAIYVFPNAKLAALDMVFEQNTNAGGIQGGGQ